MNSHFPILSACLAWPLLGALVVMVVPGRQSMRVLALLIGLIELVLTLGVVSQFDPANAGFQLVEDLAWIPSLNVRYQLGVDGISLWFLPLAALLTLTAMVAGWNSIQRLHHFHIALLLALESITIGVFTALDLALFFLFWELTLPPLFFLIGLWGIGAERRAAAMKYVLYMLFGGVPLLFGMVLLALDHAGRYGELSFNLPALLATGLSAEWQGPVFLLLLLGFAVKTPLLPLHTWLPTTALEAPPQITAQLLGLKLGVYGLIRFAIPLAPSAALEHRWLMAILGALTLLYGALLALQQSNLRRLLAYAGVSHVGMVVVAVSTFNLQGMQGALMQLLNFGLVAASLMLIAGMIHQRVGSNEALQLGGLAKTLPRLSVLFFLFALSSIGVPGLSGFPAEWLMLLGALKAYPALAVVALLVAILAASYTLNFARRAFFGPVIHAAVERVDDLRRREALMLALPALLVLLLGFYPQALLDSQRQTLENWLQHLQSPALMLTSAKSEAVARH